MFNRPSRAAYWRVAGYFVAGAIPLWLLLPASTHYEVEDAIRLTILKFQGGDALERRMRSVVPDAIDCGRSHLREDVSQATDCALRAFNGRKSFRVRYDMQGIDSDVAIGLVGTADGTVTAMLFDGDPQGGGGTSLSRQRVSEKPCPVPVKLFKSANGRVNCLPPDPKAQRSIMSPTFQPY